MSTVRILGTGSFLPPKVLTNLDLVNTGLDTTDDWIEKYGNISSASCAIALDEAIRDQSIQPDELICLPVFGGGLTWGSALIRW